MTLLSQQLQKLVLPRERVKRGAIQHSSLIFSATVASDYEIQEILDIGVNGLEELASLNPCFERFKETLFHPTSAKFERLTKSEEVLEGIDADIELFLSFVSHYGLLSPAHKALEWLVRAFKINIYNAEAFLAAFIPLHDSKLFAKILEIVTLPDNWAWLEDAKANSVNVGRAELVKLCTSNPHYLSYFMEKALHIIDLTGNQARIHHSFLVTLVFLVLETFQEVPPDVIPKIYSCLLNAISSSNKDLQSAGYILTGQVLRKMCLKDSIVKELLRTIALHPNPALIREMVLCVSCVLHYHPVPNLPLSLVEVLLQDNHLTAISLIHDKNDISGFIKQLLSTVTKLCFSTHVIDLNKACRLYQLHDLSDVVSIGLVECYFNLFFESTLEVRALDRVNLLGDLLSTNFPTQVQDIFQKYHSQGCDMSVLDQLKSLILGKYIGNDSSQKMLEINHDLPSIRMLGLLKISEKLDSGKEVLAGEKHDICSSIITRITDKDDSVSLKSLELVKQFVEDEAILQSVLIAVSNKVQAGVSEKNTSPETGVCLVSTLLNFPQNEAVMNTLLMCLINVLPLCDDHCRKQISVHLRSSKELRKLSNSMVGEDWYDHLLAQIQNYENRQGLVGSMCDIPTPENFKLICCLVEGAEIGEARIMCSYFLSLLNTAIDRKFEYTDFPESSLPAMLNEAPTLFGNFTVMKQESEMVGVVLSFLTSLAPKISGLENVKKILLYLVRSCHIHPPHRPLLTAMNKTLLYRVAMKVILNDNPGEVLSSEGLPDPECLEHLLELVRLVKVKDEDLVTVLPDLICALVAPSDQVRSWSYLRLKRLSKLNPASSPACAVLKELNISKNMSLQELKEELGRSCSSDSSHISAWLDDTLPVGRELPQLNYILGAIQHPTKLAYSLQLVKAGCCEASLLGDFTSSTTALISSDASLWELYLACLSVNPGLLGETLTADFLETLPQKEAVIKTLLEECQKDRWEEHVKITITQKLAELGSDETLKTLLDVLKSTDSFNPHAIQVLNMQGTASVDLATTLFEILPVQKGREEEIITLLTTVCSKLGLKTPLTPTALRAVVDVIRETNKQTHRHSLHHGCVVLLSKLAVSFPALVLDHVIAIFTFMGDSTMRMDDNYSIQVLMDAISTIIPVMRHDVLGILRVFCDNLPHIPSHRTDPIFSLLLQTTGPKHLYHVFVLSLELCSRDRELASQFSYFLQNLCVHFGITELLDAAVALTKTLAKLPEKLGKPMGNSHKVRLDSGVELSFNDAKHYTYFKLGLATQLYLLTTSKHFTVLLSETSEGNESALAELIELCLSIMIHYQDTEADKFVEMLNKRLTGVTISVTAELPCSMFMSVVKALLVTETTLLHTKCLNILHNRIKGESGWSDEMEESTVSLLDTLLKLGDSLTLTWTVLDLLVNKIGDKYATDFLKVLSTATSHLGANPAPELLQCVSSCVKVLGVRTLPLLPALVGVVVGNVAEFVPVLSVLVAVVPHFLSAYLKDILIATSLDYKKEMSVLTGQIGKHMKIRVLLPALSETAGTVVASSKHSLLAITDTLSWCVESCTAHEIKQHAPDISSIFIKLLSYRSTTTRFEALMEEAVISTFLCLVYKMTEKEFLPLLLQILQWSDDSTEKSTTFYNLTSQLSDKLQGLFLLFGGSLFTNIVEKLTQHKPEPSPEEFESKKARKSATSDLVVFVLKTLHNMLKFDKTHSFVLPDRFETLLPVLLEFITLSDITHLTPALAQLPVAANSDRLWKQFNFQLLNLSKSHDPKVRLNVVTVYHEFIQRLGQDYSSLLPDTLPFLAELLEDSDPTVEEMTHSIVKTIENTTGESMDQYL